MTKVPLHFSHEKVAKLVTLGFSAFVDEVSSIFFDDSFIEANIMPYSTMAVIIVNWIPRYHFSM